MGIYAYVLAGPSDLWRVLSRCARGMARAALLAAGVLHGVTLYAHDHDHDHDGQTLLIFPDVTADRSFGPSVSEDNDTDAGFSAFLARDLGSWRLLAEVLVSTDEQEIERAEVGWNFTGQSMAWLGRFHNPLGFWNTYYHHGAYMQTSITRPAIFEYEDHDGPLPSHLAGLLIEGSLERGSSGWYYELAAGAAPELQEHLEPVNVLRPTDGSHQPGATLRLSYRPDSEGHNQAGVYFAHTHIAGAESAPTDVTQQVAGGFVFWQWSGTALRAEALNVTNDFDTPLAVRGSFVSAYAQLEQRWRSDWTLYGRVEVTWGGERDAYLAHFTLFPEEHDLLGLRYELTPRQALKLEFGRVHPFAGDEYSQASLQWAAVYP